MTEPLKEVQEVKCPRCEQMVRLRQNLTLAPHRDNLISAPCPCGAMDVDQAQKWVDEARSRAGVGR